jgi:hypothetical protein
VIEQIIQIFGSLLILGAFAGAQFRRLKQDSLSYLTVNALGSGILAVLAFREHQWGFLLLEGTWCLVSLLSLIRQLARWRHSERKPSSRSSGSASA